jgi:hypothetical protein
MMPAPVASMWLRLPPDPASRTKVCIDQGCDRLGRRQSGSVFFRADDVAVPSKSLERLLKLFSRRRIPLCLAVVPAWLTAARWRRLEELTQSTASLWCWHQHGWRHANHETTGKKQEFGPGRRRAAVEHDLVRGRLRLEYLLGEHFYPVFTPPWNRCDRNTLELLQKWGYAAVSRSCGSIPPAPPGLPDFCMNVDLHTRRERNSALGWNHFFEELSQALRSGFCGIMIHHQRMNDAAFDFLDMLLKNLKDRKDLQFVDFKDMAEGKI